MNDQNGDRKEVVTASVVAFYTLTVLYLTFTIILGVVHHGA